MECTRRNARRLLLPAVNRSNAIELLESRTLLSTIYYVSPSGSDNNAGTSTAAPWASVAKVDATTFQPGDQILFQRGGEWHGLLTASSSGTSAAPIIYGDYGTGVKPIFDGSDLIPNTAFTLVSGTTYSFSTSSVPNSGGNAYWVYSQNTSAGTDLGLLAATASDNSAGGVQSNAGSFYINGTTVYVNTNGVDPRVAGNNTIFTLGDRGAGTNPNSSLINSNSKNYVTFQNIIGRETIEVGSGNSLSNGINDGYVYRIQGGSNITLLNDEGDYGSKHIVGAIDTTGFIANGLLCQGAPEGVAGNGLPYGNATATVAYSDNDTGDTSQWINVTVQNYDGGQPAFLTHGNPNAIASILLQNFVSIGSPIALEPASGVTITILGGKITDNTLTAYSGTGVTELIDGMTFTGSGSAIEVYGNSTVQNCLFVGSSQSNQAVQVSGTNNLIRFNTIVAGGAASPIYLENGTTSATIYGNIISGTGNTITKGNSAATYTADYDLYDSTFGGSLTAQQAAGQEAHGIAANPKFTNVATGDYSLQSGSPAINTIPTTGITGITTDIRGYARPSGNAYDMGAYEAISTPHQPTIATVASATPNPVTGTSTNLSVLGASVDGETTLSYTWSVTGTPPAPVTFSANGNNAAKNTTATFTKAGTYNFLVTATNGTYSVTSSVAVNVNQVTQGLTISPVTMFVAINTTQQYTAIVADQFGNPVAGSSVTYSIASGGGTINSSGLFTAPGTTGTTSIRATSGSSSATATATITPPNQAPTVATPASANPNPVTSTTTTLSVLGADDNGEANLTYTWALIGNPPAAVTYSVNGTNAAKSTVATFSANGAYNFLVTIKDSGGLTTTSSVTVNVSIFVPIVLDGNLDGRYGTPLTTTTVTTNIGSNGTTGVLGAGTKTAYSQLVAGYGVIDEQSGKFDLFLAGSFSLNNSHLDLLIDSVPGQGASNLNALSTIAPYDNGSGFSQVTLDTGFRPDYIFTSAYGAGMSLNYYNFDTGASGNNNLSDPATTTVTTTSPVPLFSERVNNAAVSAPVSPANAASLTTGAEFSFDLAGLNYTAADYAAGDSIGVFAIITFGSHTQFSNQSLAPMNPTAAETSANGGSYFGSNTDYSNAAYFPGNQYFTVPVPAAAGGPTVATPAAVNPNPVTGTTAALSVLGADSAGESTLSYTWSTTGTPPAAVAFSINGTNAAKNTTATFTANGTYNFLVTITDGSGLTTTSTVTATVTGVGTTNQPPTVTTSATATPSPVTGTTTALSVLGADDGGESNLTYTWATTGTPPAVVTFSTNGTNAAKNTAATFTKAGSYSFTVTITDAGGLSTTSSVVVIVNQTPTTITLLPTTASVAANATQQFTATVYDQFGGAISSPSMTYSILSGAGSISTTGLYTAPNSVGSSTVQVVSGSLSATAAVTITSTANQSPTVGTPASAATNPVTGMTTALSVLGTDPAGESNLSYAWTSISFPANAPPVTFSANFTNAAKNTTARFYQAGSYTFTVTITDVAGYSTTSTIAVTVNQSVQTLYVLPPKVTVAGGGTQQYIVRARDQFSNTIASPSVAWLVSGGGSISSTGLFTASQSGGSYMVTAISGAATATTTVTVQPTAPAVVPAAGLASSNGLIDVGNGGLIVPSAGATGLTTVQAKIRQGANFAAGYWNGTIGITSSTAADDTTYLTAVGVMLNNNGNAINPSAIYTNFEGAATSLNDVLVKYTYYGDTNLDGKVDGSDYARIDSGYLTHASGWFNGDFNYDGVVDGSDYTLIDNAFNQQGAAMPATAIAAAISQPAKRGQAGQLLAPAAPGLFYASSGFGNVNAFSATPIRRVANAIFGSGGSILELHG